MIERAIPECDAWELLDDEDDRVLGKIERKIIGRGHTEFWAAWGVHPGTGKLVPLELSADREERLRTVAAFRADPDQFRQHWA